MAKPNANNHETPIANKHETKRTLAALVLDNQALAVELVAVQIVDGVVRVAIILEQHKAIVRLDVDVADAACVGRGPRI